MNSDPAENQEQQVTKDRSNETPSVPSGTPPQSGTPSQKGQANADNGSNRHEGKHWVEYAILIVGTIVMLIYAGQLYEMRRTVALQTKALHIDQRAWVAPDGIVGTSEATQAYVVTVLLKNTRARPTGKFEVYGPYNNADDNCGP